MRRGPAPDFHAGSFFYDARNQLSEGAGASYAYGVLGDRIGIRTPEFAFANGNPVDGIDPFGLATMSVTTQSFIAAPVVTAPWFALIAGARGPFSFFAPGARFLGDNRGFLNEPSSICSLWKRRHLQDNTDPYS